MQFIGETIRELLLFAFDMLIIFAVIFLIGFFLKKFWQVIFKNFKNK